MAGQQIGLTKGLHDNAYTGMLCKSVDQPDWRTPTLIARFAEESGVETFFILTAQARTQFLQFETTRIYDMKIKGTCVKNNSMGVKYGVKGLHEVRMQHACAVTVAKKAWPLKMQEDTKPFGDLNQCQDGVFVDLRGRLLHKTDIESTGPNDLPKMVFTMGDGTYQQELELLGANTSCDAKVDDILLIKGAAVKEYKTRRCVQTGYMTHITVNPPGEHNDLPSLNDMEGEPKRKAICLARQGPLTVAALCSLRENMEADERVGATVEARDVQFIGQFAPLNAAFFDADAPTINDYPNAKYLYRGEVADATGSMDVVLWDAAAKELFGLSANRFLEEWYKALEEPEEREKFTKTLGERFAKKILPCRYRQDVQEQGWN
jgi:hypothetical protein